MPPETGVTEPPTSSKPSLPPIRSGWLRAALVVPKLGLLLAVVLASYAYFVGAPAWNQNSRFALTRALVERGETAIDPDHHTTGDKSFREGRFYSDKAPGVSWFSMLPYAGYTAVRQTVGLDGPSFAVQSLDPKVRALGAVLEPQARLPGDRLVYSPAYRFALYLCTLFVVAVPSAALGATGVLLLVRHLTDSDRAAQVAALTYALGTPAWVYSTSLYGHQLCASLLIAAFATLILAPRQTSPRVPWAIGSLLGMAVVTEYPCAPVVVALVLISIRTRSVRFAMHIAAGGVPWALLLAAYHTAAFGGPLATGYDFVYREEFAAGMAVRYGLGFPDPSAALALTFGSFRGLFYLSPVLLLAAWGLVRTLSSTRGRLIGSIAASVCVYFWLLNAGYYMWDGGASAGPRHMLPALPFLALGLGAAFVAVPRAFAVLAAVSIMQALLLASASPEVAQHGDPLWQFAIDRVLSARPGAGAGHSNLGLLLGLPSAWSLLPLLALWGWAWTRRSEPDPQSADSIE